MIKKVSRAVYKNLGFPEFFKKIFEVGIGQNALWLKNAPSVDVYKLFLFLKDSFRKMKQFIHIHTWGLGKVPYAEVIFL